MFPAQPPSPSQVVDLLVQHPDTPLDNIMPADNVNARIHRCSIVGSLLMIPGGPPSNTTSLFPANSVGVFNQVEATQLAVLTYNHQDQGTVDSLNECIQIIRNILVQCATITDPILRFEFYKFFLTVIKEQCSDGGDLTNSAIDGSNQAALQYNI